jgi:hypothetical protein
VRRLGFWLFTGLQGAIAATGNYGFFNVLAAALGLWLLDDEALLRVLPIRAKAPRYVRAVLYEYRMTDLETRRRTGLWWRREPIGLYFPEVSLGPRAVRTEISEAQAA